MSSRSRFRGTMFSSVIVVMSQDVVRSLVSKVGVDVNAPDADGNTPLHW